MGESNPENKTMRKATRAIGGRVEREGQMAWRDNGKKCQIESARIGKANVIYIASTDSPSEGGSKD